MLHHTNIVPVFAVGEEGDSLYYAMQYISGATLDDVIQERHALWKSSPTADTRLTDASVPTDEKLTDASQVAQALLAASFAEEHNNTDSYASTLLRATEESAKVGLPGQTRNQSSSGSMAKCWESFARIGIQVASALAHAYSRGTLHRDIKPGNLMLDQTGTVWVMDFGLAKSPEQDDLTREGEIVGVLPYMSPEQCKGHPIDASDLYSLGLVLYKLLALRPAYDEVHRSELLRAGLYSRCDCDSIPEGASRLLSILGVPINYSRSPAWHVLLTTTAC